MTNEPKVTLSASVPPGLKERFQRIAEEKRWSLSQTVIVFIEEYLGDWEDALEIKSANPPTQPKRKKSQKPS